MVKCSMCAAVNVGAFKREPRPPDLGHEGLTEVNALTTVTVPTTARAFQYVVNFG